MKKKLNNPSNFDENLLSGNSNKFKRLINIIISGPSKNRKGSCTPDVCETLSGEKGSACCKLGYRCPALGKKSQCSIYKVRPLNCRAFPISEDDLKLVKNCGYWFEQE
jgi:Fe-S-cluster containining protein